MDQLVKYNAACKMVAACVRVDEAKNIRDASILMKLYARQVENRDLEADAVAIRMRATRRMDQLRQAQKETVGLNEGTRGSKKRGARVSEKPTLASQGIDKNLAHQMRVLGAMSEAQFEKTVSSTRAAVAAAVDAAAKAAEAEARRKAKAAQRRALLRRKDFALPPGITVLQGDCKTVMATLPDASVHCVVTSPPYWGLRDFGGGEWKGGDPKCNHRASTRTAPTGGSYPHYPRDHEGLYDGKCEKCGAVREPQLGLEATPEEYVRNVVEIFREIWRVLRMDGTVWLNLGDCYAGSGKGSGIPSIRNGGGLIAEAERTTPIVIPAGCKNKDLMLVPFEVAKALRNDGWYLRQDIVWHKPSPIPESVGDRCTKAHEYIFLLSKQENYFFDAEAIREDPKPGNDGRMSASAMDGFRNGRTERRPQRQVQYDEIKGANRRSVWTIATVPYPDEHTATFPPELPERCILAGCPPGGTVLDPFAGTGTVGEVALRNGRSAVLIELNAGYCDAIRARLGVTAQAAE
jgi:DNA modification methylase